MGIPTTPTKAKLRKILITEITGPTRAMAGEKVTFKILKCTIDGKVSSGSDLTDEEGKKIKWLFKEASAKPFFPLIGSSRAASYKLEAGRELKKGTGKSFVLTVPPGMAGKAIVATAYINTPSSKIVQWVKVSASKDFKLSSTSHKALTAFPEIKKIENLDSDFKVKWEAFAKALDEAGAIVDIDSTKRSLGRAYMMHYCTLLSKGKIKSWEIPDQITNSLGAITGHVGVEWSHSSADGRVDEVKSVKAATAMMQHFKIAYPASLTSNHVQGKALDVLIKWTGTLKIKEKGGKGKDNKETEGKVHEIKSTPKHGGKKGEPAGNKELVKVAKTYGVYKHLTDAPHWSVNGR